MKVYNSTKNILIGDHINVADNIVTRTIGLLSKKSIKKGEGIVIKPCCSIHTFFMRFEIDVIFIKKNGEVLEIYKKVKPFRILPIHLSAYSVLEISGGYAEEIQLGKGDIIKISDK